MKTAGYRGVAVKNFSSSWTNGLAFCALIHKHRPDLIDFDHLDPGDALGNLRTAFTVAERDLGIDSLIDAEDVIEDPDEKSIMTQLMAYYNYFSSTKDSDLAGQRIKNFLDFELEMNADKRRFEEMTTGAQRDEPLRVLLLLLYPT